MKLIPVWHGHHNTLITWLESVAARKRNIKENKPKHEHALRLRLIKKVKGPLPPGFVKARDAYSKVRDAYSKARDAYSKARDAYTKSWDAYSKEWNAYSKEWNAYIKAWGVYSKVWDAYSKALQKYLPEIEALHAKECPNCPWNGNTIFSKKEAENV